MFHSEIQYVFAHLNDENVDTDRLIGSPEVHAGGSHPGQEPAATQTVRPVPGRHRADQLEVCGGAAEGVSPKGDLFPFFFLNEMNIV